MPSSASQVLHIVPIRLSREAERLRLVIWAVWRVLEEHRHRLEIIVRMVGHLQVSVSIVLALALVVLLAPTESRIVVALACVVTAMVRAGTQLEEIGQNVLPAIGLANASLAMVRASASIVMEQARASIVFSSRYTKSPHILCVGICGESYDGMLDFIRL